MYWEVWEMLGRHLQAIRVLWPTCTAVIVGAGGTRTGYLARTHLPDAGIGKGVAKHT